MNKLSVLAKNVDTYFIKRLIGEVGIDHLRLINPWKEQNLSLDESLLVRTTSVYGDNKDLEFIERWKGPVFNPLECLRPFRTKSTQYRFFEKHNHPILPWMNLRHHSLDVILKNTLEWNSLLLLKPDRGQGGWGIRTIKTSELENWWMGLDHEFVIQPYIENAKEFRVFFCKAQAPLILERQGVEVSNFAREGKARLSQVQMGTMKIVEEAIALSGAHYGAIDLFETLEGPKILELNISPGVEQLEKVSGENIIKKLLRSIKVSP